MDRVFVSFPITDFGTVKRQLLHWASRFSTVCYLDNNEYTGALNSFECIVGAGTRATLQAAAGNAFSQLKQFSEHHNDWLFGHLSFELKQETERVASASTDPIGFSDLAFFVPEIVIQLSKEQLRIGVHDKRHAAVIAEILSAGTDNTYTANQIPVVRPRYTRTEYINIVEALRAHILRGDCYEINFCQQFGVENYQVDPVGLYERLTALSPAPFAAYYRQHNCHLICASPERYLKRAGQRLSSQPMKGTGSRNLSDPDGDERNRQALAASEKDRAENVMVVDLVRNDLSRIAEKDSVRVESLYNVQTYAQVHQLVSTVQATAKKGLDWTALLGGPFPMGSMTGAPKKRVLELIERYETTGRGLFSGSVGYVSPERDFDFNVVIRSILYNAAERYLSYFAGSGITFASNAEAEYDECRLKADAIERVIKNPVAPEA